MLLIILVLIYERSHRNYAQEWIHWWLPENCLLKPTPIHY